MPSDLPHALAYAMLALAGSAALYWAIVLVRLALLLPKIPSVRAGLRLPPPAEGWPSVSIVVPAHDEERVIESCVGSLLASDYPRLEVVVVLDRCTDRTRELLRPFEARDPRLVVVENGTCPEDWAGKCNAARVGAERAGGAWLLFTDADVRFAPELVRASVALAVGERRGLLSLLPTLVAEAWYERIMQPVAAMTLLRMYPIDKVNRDTHRRAFANGQFMLFDRRTYARVGGHAAVKDDLLEDIAFARLVDQAGERCGLAVSDGMLVVHMYASFAAMRAGWKRIFIEACRRRPDRLRKNALRVAWLGAGVPVTQAAALLAGAWASAALFRAALAVVGIGLALQAVALTAIYLRSRARLSGALFFPIGSLLVAQTLWRGAADLVSGRPVRWGGKAYVLEPRRPAPRPR